MIDLLILDEASAALDAETERGFKNPYSVAQTVVEENYNCSGHRLAQSEMPTISLPWLTAL